MTYKTASQLKDAMKSMRRRAIRSSTLREHSTGLNELREMHTDGDRNRQFTADFAQPHPAAVAHPRQVHRAVGVETEWSDDEDDLRTPAELARANNNGRKRGRKTPKKAKAKSRCRKCGKEYDLPE